MRTSVTLLSILVGFTAVHATPLIHKRQQPVETDPLGTPNLIINGDFSNATHGWLVQPPGALENGSLCVNVPGNGSANASFIQTTNNFTEVKNDIYYLNFTAYASRGINLWLNTQGSDPSAGGAPVG